MGERTEYAPGTFSWTDLTTHDQEAAKAFYGELFGWEVVDMPVEGDVYYSMAKLDGKDVAAISPQPQQQIEAGVPPAWNSYITVVSADAALHRASELGAMIHAEAFDVLDIGRMGVVRDPQGAFFLVWEPKTHIGASLVNAPGALSWNELATPDMDASAAFYADLFGWTVERFEGMQMPYMAIRTAAGRGNGGIRPAMPPGMPPHWLVYFGSDDIPASLQQVKELGGAELVSETDIGVGKIAVVQDPQGATFAFYAGEFED